MGKTHNFLFCADFINQLNFQQKPYYLLLSGCVPKLIQILCRRVPRPFKARYKGEPLRKIIL